MKRILLTLCAVFTLTSLLAGEKPKTKEKVSWNKGIATTVGLTQLSLTNWAAGGVGQLSLNLYADAYANGERGKFLWSNELQIGYGFVHSFEKNYLDKSDDRLIFDSKLAYKAVDKLSFSLALNFRSQFSEGWDSKHTVITSDLLAPAYTTLGLGLDYSPVKNVNINFAPLTGKMTVVRDQELRTRYGNAEDQMARFELGAQLRVDGKLQVENFKVTSSLILFSDYLNKPQNLKVNWDVNAEAKISKFFSVTLRTNMIYDDKIKLTKVRERTGETYEAAGIQFKELFSIGFSYTFGEKKKKK